jgi:alpha-1,2-mannosyltransferase
VASSVIDPPGGGSKVGWSYAMVVAAFAFAVRLVTVLRGGGLFGRIGYDGSVYYASAAALARGFLPYRDFLLLHPPGIALALLPFAALGRLVGDADAYALARLCWFGLGAVSTMLVFRIVRARGLWPAVAAAAFYAVFVPAVTSEHTTSLEAVGSVCLLGAVALLTIGRDRRPESVVLLVAAGVLLGVSTGTKIWGVTVVVAVVAWSARRMGLRSAALVLAGAVGSTVVICLPFLLAAPGAMWRMVVADQFGRSRVPGSLIGRLVDVAGFSRLRGELSTNALALLALTFLAVVLVLAVGSPLGRLAALLLAVTTAVLLSTPPWSVAYTGLAAPPLALLVGCAVGRVAASRVRARPIAALTVVAALIAYAAAVLPGLTFGTHFPGRSVERGLAAAPGCVTTDDPIALIETKALRRNLDLRCPLIVDLSGYSYDLQPYADRRVNRLVNPEWQQFVQHHLASGAASVVVRFRTTPGLSRQTKAVIAGWPVLVDVAGYQVRHPSPHVDEFKR